MQGFVLANLKFFVKLTFISVMWSQVGSEMALPFLCKFQKGIHIVKTFQNPLFVGERNISSGSIIEILFLPYSKR
jgi:hypothetical protein